jgi:DNA-binding Lrp family transcriptional regulator
MDAKDVWIFCEIAFKGIDYDSFTDRRVSPSAIGKKLGLDEKTVRSRVKKMENDGFIKYYQAMPRLGFFEFKNVNTYRFEALNIATKHGVINYVGELPFVVDVVDYLGNVVSISITGSSSEEIDKVATEIANRFELFKWRLGSCAIKKPLIVPDKLDWKLIQKLRYNALSGINEISDSLSITTRMVRYKITKLLDAEMLTVRAIINSQKQQGLIFYELELSVNTASRYKIVKHLREIYADKLWSIRTIADKIILANFFAFTLAEPEEAYVNVLKIEGVRSCSLFIFKEIVEPKRQNWMDDLIDQKIITESKSG